MTYTGRDVRRLEDADLLRGAGRFADDLPVRRDTLHAAILRSPHAHAEILSVDAEGALALPGVDCVVTGEDARCWTRPFAVAVKTAMQHWCLAVDRVRYVGEPVAVALACDRHTAEDALERIAVRYRLLPPVVDAEKAAEADAPLLHPAVGSNVVSDRAFRYGDPEAAFVTAAHRVSVTTRYPRNAASPLECFVVIAEYLPGDAAYEVIANFQGPFAMHPVMAMALGVPGNRLRLRTPPHSGGSFGAKHALFPYVVLMALAARKAGRPVKWVESRLEHLTAATSATNRVTTLSAAVDRDGVVAALAWDQLEDCGAYLRAPEPATLYRMHANMTGAYRVRDLSC
jgi:2-furoyl-CoA dehydrogenase large subunit